MLSRLCLAILVGTVAFVPVTFADQTDFGFDFDRAFFDQIISLDEEKLVEALKKVPDLDLYLYQRKSAKWSFDPGLPGPPPLLLKSLEIDSARAVDGLEGMLGTFFNKDVQSNFKDQGIDIVLQRDALVLSSGSSDAAIKHETLHMLLARERRRKGVPSLDSAFRELRQMTRAEGGLRQLKEWIFWSDSAVGQMGADVLVKEFRANRVASTQTSLEEAWIEVTILEEARRERLKLSPADRMSTLKYAKDNLQGFDSDELAMFRNSVERLLKKADEANLKDSVPYRTLQSVLKEANDFQGELERLKQKLQGLGAEE